MNKVRVEKPAKELQNLKDLFQKNTLEKLKIITDESCINVEENQKLVQNYHECVKDAEDLRDNILSLKNEKRDFIILDTVLVIVGIICSTKAFYTIDDFSWEGWRAVLLCFALSFAAFVCFYICFRTLLYVNNNLTPLLADKQALQIKLDKKTEEAEDSCYKNLEPFMSNIDEFFFKDLLQNTLDGFEINEYLDALSVKVMESHFPDIFSRCENESTLDLISGNLFDNLFVIRKFRTQYMSYVQYEGQKEITIEMETTDYQGNKVITTKKETVKASITRPKPEYSEDYELLFVSDNAPDLSFSHNMEKPKSLGRRKALIEKKHRNAIIYDNSGFTPMSNSEFDTLFFAINRDNDLQFRELFTPVAQKNHVDLITDLGDYYSLCKNKRLSTVKMKDNKLCWNLWNDPIKYRDIDFETMKKKIVDANNECFNHFIRFFLPILSTPNYYRKGEKASFSNIAGQLRYSELQAEVLANHMDESIFTGKNTSVMIFAKGDKADNDVDYYTLSIQYYDEYPRVETCYGTAKDGSRHPIDIEWIEYVPQNIDYHIMIKEIGVAKTAAQTNNDISDTVLKQGLFGFVYSGDEEPDREKFNLMIAEALHE